MTDVSGDVAVIEDLELIDYRRRVGDLYRLPGGGAEACAEFRRCRDELFRTHPQSALSETARIDFRGLRYFAYDPTYRVSTRLQPAPDDDTVRIDTGGPDGTVVYRRAGRLRLELPLGIGELTVFAIAGYAGGLFLPFRDATCGRETYGGGRYLFDTIKNTDGYCLEVTAGSDEVVLDFNYAYNPSCAYDERWACPLAPHENWLPFRIEAGEMI